jgi:serine/threonine protein kinase
MSDVGELYDCGRILGEGTFAIVSLVCDADGRQFAAKTKKLPPGVRASPVEPQVLSLCAAQGARNILRLHRTIHDGHVLILEYCDGGTVANYIYNAPPLYSATRRTPISRSREALRIACDVTCALMDLHSLGIIHRDVKPSNMLLRCNGTAVLADLGDALCAPHKVESQLYGTPGYLAPELLLWHCPYGCTLYEYTQAVDVWALGITLFELLFGHRPFDEVRHFPDDEREAAVWRCLRWLEGRRSDAVAWEDFAFAALCDAIRRCLTYNRLYRPSAASVHETLTWRNVT